MTRAKKNQYHTKRFHALVSSRRELLRIGALATAVLAPLTSVYARANAKSRDPLEVSDKRMGKETSGLNNDDLQLQIHELRAREEIKELRAKYCWYATRADTESYAKLFTSDCSFEYKTDGKRRVFEGRAALSAIVAAIAPGTVTPIIGNHTIVIDGHEAVGTCAARNTIKGADGKSLTVVGFYDDKFRYEEGRWLFSERRWFTYSPEYEENNVLLV